MGIFFTNFKLLLPTVSYITDTIFTPLPETLYAAFDARCVSVRHLQDGVLGERPEGNQKYGSRTALNCDCREDENIPATVAIASLVRRLVCGLVLSSRRTWFIFLFGRTLRIRCFKVFSVCTYRSELIVAHVSKNFIQRLPSPPQKTVAIILAADVRNLNFSCVATADDATPVIVFLSLSRNDEPKFHHQ